MLFSLEVLQAYHGDCLILHYGQKSEPGCVVIDGGPARVYRESLRPRLNKLRKAHHGDESLPIDYLIVTHVDDDHIHGVLDLMKDIKDNQAPYEIMSLWHNSFDDVLGNVRDELFSALGASIAGRAMPANISLNDTGHISLPVIAAGIAQGRKVHEMAQALDLLPLNAGFPRLVMTQPNADNAVELGENVKLTVLGPDEQSIKDLQEEWDEANDAGNAEAFAAAYADNSVANLSSIVVMVECKRKRMLLTGDARGDQILKGLKEAGFLKRGKCKVDILKLPHHGSHHNVEPEFFQKVWAKHYVVSGDGKYGNPEIATLQMLCDARPDNDFTLHLTNRTGKEGLEKKLRDFFAQRQKAGRPCTVNSPPPGAKSMTIDLLDEVTY